MCATSRLATALRKAFKIHACTLLLPAICLFGCVSSTRVTSADQYEEINAQGREHRAMITVQGDSATTEYTGDYVSIARDSLQ